MTVSARDRAASLRPEVLVALVVAVVAVARLPFLGEPLTSDEAGFLMIGGQWHDGDSLYGDYWVDRPPLLIGLFALADALGGGLALRLMGIVWVMAAVVLAALLGRRLAPGVRRAPVYAAATAAVFLLSPLFGALQVDGELLAVPFVLAGLLALVCALDAPSPRRASAYWAAAGVAAVLAGAVKQNMVGVAVGAVAVLLTLAVRREWATLRRAGAAFGAAALATVLVLVGWAAWHGTSVTGLFDAVVTFRLHASAVISSSASSATTDRALGLLVAFLASGAPVLLGLVVACLPRGGGAAADPMAAPVRALVISVLAWDLFGVAVGGSYWHHYLLGLVPGMVFAVAAALRWRPDRRVRVRGVLAAAATVTAVALAVGLVTTPDRTPETRMSAFLDRESSRVDTAVMAFGSPSVLYDAGLSSPYQELWSLPVRVRDPRLHVLAAVLDGPNRPTWVIVDRTDGRGMATWGVRARRAQRVLAREYRPVRTFDRWTVYTLLHPLVRADDRRSPTLGR